MHDAIKEHKWLKEHEHACVAVPKHTRADRSTTVAKNANIHMYIYAYTHINSYAYNASV